jgi:hypothetical protein
MKNYLRGVAIGVSVLALSWLGSHTQTAREAGHHVFALVAGTPKAVVTTQLCLCGLAVLLFVSARIVAYLRSEKRAIRKHIEHQRQMDELNKKWKPVMDIIGRIR